MVGWPSGLRRYVQVVVYFVGAGSNPASTSLLRQFESYFFTCGIPHQGVHFLPNRALYIQLCVDKQFQHSIHILHFC